SGSQGSADGERGGGRGRGFGGDPAERQARMMERFKSMDAAEQKQFIARMEERGQDTRAFEKLVAPAAKSASGKKDTQGAETIDALFAPLPPVESRGRVWVFMDNQLKPVNVRLGITDGTNTELIGGELQANMEVVTSVSGAGST